MYATSLEPVSAASTSITSTMTSSEIQSAIDSSSAGDTINFLGKVYENIQLTINKTLNIVTSAGTVLTGYDPNSAVFLINGPQASGTRISGFNITGPGSGILINNTSGVTLSGDNINSTGTSVTVNQSSNTVIKNVSAAGSSTGINVSNSANTKITGSNITNNRERGVGIYNSNNTSINNSTINSNGDSSTSGYSSDGGAVYVKGSNGVKITGNQIKGNSQGVTAADSCNVDINNNTITDNYGEGILLNGTLLENISVKSNDIEKNSNGIVLNYNKGININISGNIITKSMWNSLPDGEDSGNGISFGSGYTSNSGTGIIEHNVIMNNAHKEIDAHDSAIDTVSVGSNWYGTTDMASGIECKVNTDAIYLKLVRTGENTYMAYFINNGTKEIVTDLPSIPVTFTAGNLSKTIMTQNGTAIAVFNNLTNGSVIGSAYGANVSISYNSIIINHPNGIEDPNSGGSGGGSGSISAVKPAASANYKSGWYNKNLIIKLSMNKTGTIYYTTNGATPTTSSKKYTGAFTINKSTTLKFIAVDKAGNKSSIYTAKYIIDKTRPYIKAIYPKKNSRSISRSKTLYIKFSENLKTSINWSKVYIKNLKTGKKVAVSKIIKNNVLYLKTGKRSAYTWYQIYIPAAAIKDAAGNKGIGYTWKFKTGKY